MEQERSLIKDPWLWLIFGCYLGAGLISFNRGLDLTDEGFHLYYSWMIALGQRIYKDYVIDVPPFSLMVNAVLIKLFGLKIIVSRVYSLCLGCCGFFTLAYLSRRIVPGRMALIGPIVCIFISKNLFQMSMYNIDSKFFLLFSVAFAIAWLDSNRLWFMLLSGLFAGMAVFSYQSHLAAAGAEIILVLWLREKTRSPGWLKPLISFAVGFALVGLVVGLYLADQRLVEEFFQTMLHSGGRKFFIINLLLTRIIPFYLLCAGLALLMEKLRAGGRTGKTVAGIILIACLGLLYFFTRQTPFLFANLLALTTPVMLFTISVYYLVREKSSKLYWFFAINTLIFFLVTLAGGFDAGHCLLASLLLIPWVGFVISRWQANSRVKIFSISIEGCLLLLFLLGSGFYTYLTRFELHGAAEPLYRCTAKLELESARGIYVPPEQKRDLETMVKKIDQFAKPGQRILVYAHYHLIYVLAQRLSYARGISFAGEMHDVHELEIAANQALAEKSVVVFQLQNGKIFQPLASSKAQEVIDHLAASCVEKVELKDYIVCRL